MAKGGLTGVELSQKFRWEPQPAAQKLVDSLLQDFLKKCPQAAELAKRMKDETGTRFKDWVDHLGLPESAGLKAQVREVGFTQRPVPGAKGNFVNELGLFPAIVLEPKGQTSRVALKVDSVADFLAAHRVESEILGEPFAPLRMARAFVGKGAELWVVERHGTRGHEIQGADAGKSVRAMRHLESFCLRRRDAGSDAEGLGIAERLVDAAAKDLGKDWACDLWFESERRYWMSRNYAAQVQYGRQRRLGLGWANHDHHTYRSSREHFTTLVRLWEKLGFQPREAFYAGAEAGWGAQVMEQPVCQITTFNDVDMSPEELLGDFAHEGFKEKRQTLGTVGLWCGLHGEALLQAGMHHLECVFDWYALVYQLEHEAHVKTMKPFTTFSYLRQAFTEGERWAVNEKRIDRLLASGFITREQAAVFRVEGAIGSHLENLERNDGFKGFNQKGVSDIIARTDPRKQKTLAGA